jgi:hypothetical protein
MQSRVSFEHARVLVVLRLRARTHISWISSRICSIWPGDRSNCQKCHVLICCKRKMSLTDWCQMRLEMVMGRNPSVSAVLYSHPQLYLYPIKNPYPHAGTSSYPYPHSPGFFYPSGNPYPAVYPL